MIIPVILYGGAGTRLWPLSREMYPKQLLPLVGEHTMLQETLLRLDGLPDCTAPVVVCNEEHRFMVAEQLRAIGCDAPAIILEPVGRNTAPAVAVAAMQALKDGDDPIMLVLPADHVIRDADRLCQNINGAIPLVDNGNLVTFGIVPDGPETGYGYIRTGKTLSSGRSVHPSELTAYAVAQFVEKPDLVTAQKYLAAGDYLWNSGMFMFRASRFLQELERFAPKMVPACRQAFENAVEDLDFIRLAEADFASCPADSIDYAVMEKTAQAAVVPLSAGWSDVGSWKALWDVGETNEDGNVILGDVVAVDCQGSYLHASSRLISGVGLKNLVVVETADAVLVVDKDKVQDVKQVVAVLKAENRAESLLHRRVNRPWGAYEGIDSGERFQVKRITVNPGASLSLQKHHHRAEHWVVVKGTAQVTRGTETFAVGENESTYIPLGELHRLENPGKVPLEIIEIQSGSYLGEDDIERFEDQYGR